MNQALNSFHINSGIVGGGLLKSGQINQSGARKEK